MDAVGTRFQIYYGPLDASQLQLLQEYELVILEPRHIARAGVRELQMAGTLVYGYLSVMQTPRWNAKRYAQLQEDDYLRGGCGVTHFSAWDSYLMDLRQVHYRGLLLEEIAQEITAKGLDGVLLDTVGDIEEYVPDGVVRRDMKRAYMKFLSEVRERFPTLQLLQNRGFDLVSQAVPYLDGLLWEDWRGDLLYDPWVQTRLLPLQKCQHQGLKIFSVSRYPERLHRQTAEQFRFVHLMRLDGYETFPL